MEAKDIKWCPQHGYPLPCHKCGMPLSQVQQKEIYQAGIKEVVKWVERYSESDGNNPLEFSIFPEKEWQSQKKEWILIPKTRRVGMILDLL